jgi:hypothetical protein
MRFWTTDWSYNDFFNRLVRFRDGLSKPPKPFAMAPFRWLKTLLTIIVSNLALLDMATETIKM